MSPIINLIMGDTERPRYTGFRGLSVRGITALQCMVNVIMLATSTVNIVTGDRGFKPGFKQTCWASTRAL